ncbi:MAG: tetratricopeptide repeat protein, partial [Anaerolineae bacterium]|nr:tetratricopeptide repeat protein [Anaerolineae bacterium]
ERKKRRWLWAIPGAILIFLCLCMFLALATQDERRQENALQLLEEARTARRDQDPEAALDMYEQAVKADPTLVAAYLEASDLLVEIGRIDEVTGVLQTGLEANPSSPELHQQMAGAAIALEALDIAWQEVNWLLENMPDAPSTHAYHGTLILVDNGTCEEAMPVLEKALQHEPDSPWAHYGLGLCHLQNGDRAEAQRSLGLLLAHEKTPPILRWRIEQQLSALGEGLPSAGDMGPVVVIDIGNPDNGHWEAMSDGEGSRIECTPDPRVTHNGATTLRIAYSIAPETWGVCAYIFDVPQDWSRSSGLLVWLHAESAGQPARIEVFAGDPAAPTPFNVDFVIPEQSRAEWTPLTFHWQDLARADWANEDGLQQFDPSQIVSLNLTLHGGAEHAEGKLWIENISIVPAEYSPPMGQREPPDDAPQEERLPPATMQAVEQELTVLREIATAITDEALQTELQNALDQVEQEWRAGHIDDALEALWEIQAAAWDRRDQLDEALRQEINAHLDPLLFLVAPGPEAILQYKLELLYQLSLSIADLETGEQFEDQLFEAQLAWQSGDWGRAVQFLQEATAWIEENPEGIGDPLLVQELRANLELMTDLASELSPP